MPIFKHGHRPAGKRSATYSSWEAMTQRCNNPGVPQYHNYGGRGIRKCDRWNDFSCFLEDMGERPEGTSLDRIDVDGNYTPDNCRWATAQEQFLTRKTTIQITIDGITKPLIQWLRIAKMDPRTYYSRLAKGYSASSILLRKAG